MLRCVHRQDGARQHSRVVEQFDFEKISILQFSFDFTPRHVSRDLQVACCPNAHWRNRHILLHLFRILSARNKQTNIAKSQVKASKVLQRLRASAAAVSAFVATDDRLPLLASSFAGQCGCTEFQDATADARVAQRWRMAVLRSCALDCGRKSSALERHESV